MEESFSSESEEDDESSDNSSEDDEDEMSDEEEEVQKETKEKKRAKEETYQKNSKKEKSREKKESKIIDSASQFAAEEVTPPTRSSLEAPPPLRKSRKVKRQLFEKEIKENIDDILKEELDNKLEKLDIDVDLTQELEAVVPKRIKIGSYVVESGFSHGNDPNTKSEFKYASCNITKTTRNGKQWSMSIPLGQVKKLKEATEIILAANPSYN